MSENNSFLKSFHGMMLEHRSEKKMYRIFDEISQSTNNSSRFALKIKVKKI